MAITRTALGTAQAKGNPVFSITANINAGDVVLLVWAGDSDGLFIGDGTQIEDGSGTLKDYFNAGDIVATNSGNVVTGIRRVTATRNYTVADNAKIRGTQAGSAAVAIVGVLLTGVSLYPFDKSSAGTGTGTSPSSGATATLSVEDEICIGAVGTEGPPTDAAGTWSNSFNAGQRDGTDSAGAASNVTISEGYLIVSATTAQTAAKTSITSRDWAACIATYRGFIAKPNPLLVKQAVKRSYFY